MDIQDTGTDRDRQETQGDVGAGGTYRTPPPYDSIWSPVIRLFILKPLFLQNPLNISTNHKLFNFWKQNSEPSPAHIPIKFLPPPLKNVM